MAAAEATIAAITAATKEGIIEGEICGKTAGAIEGSRAAISPYSEEATAINEA